MIGYDIFRILEKRTSSMIACVSVCLTNLTHTDIHRHTQTHTHRHTHRRTHTHRHTHTDTHSQTHTYTHARASIFTCASKSEYLPGPKYTMIFRISTISFATAVSGVANSRIGRTPFQTVRDLITAPKLYGDYLARNS